MNYQETIANIPEKLKQYAVPNWDGYNALPLVLSDEVISRTVIMLKKLEALGISCPWVGPSEEEMDLNWRWSKGDWTKSIKEQERYAWSLIMSISDKAMDEKTDCFFIEMDNRQGVSKFNDSTTIFFNFSDPIPDKILDRLKEFDKWTTKGS